MAARLREIDGLESDDLRKSETEVYVGFHELEGLMCLPPPSEEQPAGYLGSDAAPAPAPAPAPAASDPSVAALE
eukprot:4941722-Prymnesium_polylepis.1